FKQAEFDIMYGRGISREGSVLDIGVDLGFIKKSGAWYTYEGEQLGQGRENAKEFLTENAEVMVEVSERIRTEVGLGDAIEIPDDVAALDNELDDDLDDADDEVLTLED
ncbi:MAG TPA: DNA recombination/repair protein RecA, partial [Acidimicrobiales bacterium]